MEDSLIFELIALTGALRCLEFELQSDGDIKISLDNMFLLYKTSQLVKWIWKKDSGVHMLNDAEEK